MTCEVMIRKIYLIKIVSKYNISIYLQTLVQPLNNGNQIGSIEKNFYYKQCIQTLCDLIELVIPDVACKMVKKSGDFHLICLKLFLKFII